MKDLNYWKKYLKNHNASLEKMAHFGDPWVFICASCLIEYLAKMTIGESNSYAAFIRKFLSQINPTYTSFKYNTEESDLPNEMYYILRNGLVHSFTMKPNQPNKGRINSILLSHSDPHLSHRTDGGLDACIFNAHQFVEDIGQVIDLIFKEAETDIDLKNKMETRLLEFPPLQPM